MTLGALGAISFLSPWMLAGLASLPIIWWLLRLTPPRPQTVAFPPTRLFLGLKAKEKTPIKSPWWLTLLRIFVVAAIILALAGPLIKPSTSQIASGGKPIFVVADNGWTSGSRWTARQSAADQLAAAAEESGQTLYLAATAGPSNEIRPLSPAEFRQQFTALSPQAYPGDRQALAQRIEKDMTALAGNVRVVWLSDGVEDRGAEALRKALASLGSGDRVEILADAANAGPLAVFHVGTDSSGKILARILKSDPVTRSGSVAAVTARGEKLTLTPFEIPAAGPATTAAIELPLDLRNQVARLEIAGEESAGAVFLLDSRSQRRRVGVIASEEAEEAQPLLSPAHYLEKALAPFADVISPHTVNLDKATEDLVARSPSVIILSDVGRLTGAPRARLQSFVEKGGMLIRFAGSRLEQGGDDLLPAPLREGGRMLGGAMSWATPQSPAPFEAGSPFEGIQIPSEVTVSRQVLTDPAGMSHGILVWARLADGTPLVTAARRGLGMVVFYHVTANPDWSNLPLSGLFVDMIRKTVELSPLQVTENELASGADGERRDANQYAFLKPWRILNGFGRLADATDGVQAIPTAKIASQTPSRASPAGLYGPPSGTRAINIVGEKDRLSPLLLPSNGRKTVFAEAKTLALTPWLFLAALILFLLDGILTLLMQTGIRRRSAKAGFAAALIAGIILTPAHDARAEPASGAAQDEATRFALEASLETKLAYVLTGDAEADRVSQTGLSGLSKVLATRTAVEPGTPMGIDPARDELVFFPLIYWPVLANAEPLPDSVLAKIDAYMKQGGLIVFDTKNEEAFQGGLQRGAGNTALSQLLGKLDLPPLQRIPDDHVLTKAFYLLQSFPGRWDNPDTWVEARADTTGAARKGVRSDGVSSIIVTSNDLAAAWALDESDRPLYAAVPGGEDQREMSYRVGVNIVMYALTGNYKADQVHVPAILERLGH